MLRWISRAGFWCLILSIIVSGNDTVDTNYPHSLKFELGGSGLLYSFSYENCQFNERLLLDLGMGYLQIIENETNHSMHLVSVPLGASWLFISNSNAHALQLGVGLMNFIMTGDIVEYGGQTDWFLNPYFRVGYRYSMSKSPWFFHVSLTPFYASKSLMDPTERPFSLIIPGSIQPYAGLGFGYHI